MILWANMIASFLLVCWFISSLALFIYSYGFLDFNLTLSSNTFFLRFVAPLQHLVYFDRGHSAQVYAIILVFMFVAYIGTLVYWQVGKLTRFPWKFFLVLILILTLAYPMLSYDIYNYMFHAKILWFYHANPHLHAPLEYTGDLWLRFMRWVHTPSAYGPVFTAIESPSYLLGLGKFVPVLVLMKLSMSTFFVWCVYLVGKVGEELQFAKSKIILSQLMLAFNPFLLMDVVVNGHNDAVMMGLFLFALLLSFRRQIKWSLVALVASIGVKFVTALTLPIYFIRPAKLRLLAATLLMYLPILVSPARFQPWYVTWVLIPAVLLDYSWARVWILLSSLAGLIYYYPFVTTGFWNDTLWFNSVIIFPPLVLTAIYFFSKRKLSL
jgi:hypothetical protein